MECQEAPPRTVPGVWGVSKRGIGVLGEATIKVGPFEQVGEGVVGKGNTGVHGITSHPNGYGVLGTAIDLGTGVAGRVKRGRGVEGNSEAGAGVAGISGNGDGLFGSSTTGIGGSFKGGKAPLRLVPSETEGPPSAADSHAVGEFFVDKQGILYFCTAPGNPGDWKRVQLV